MFLSDSEKIACLESMTGNREMRAKVRQLLSDELSARKRIARDTFLMCLAIIDCARGMTQTLRSSCNQKRPISRKQKLNCSQSFQMVRGALVICRKPMSPTFVNLGWILLCNVNLLLFQTVRCNCSGTRLVFVFCTSSWGSPLNILRPPMVSTILCELYSYSRPTGCSHCNQCFCLRHDGTNCNGGHRQKLYHKTFKPFVVDAFHQIIGKLR